MKFYGLQKMTLLDYPGKVAATVFTGGCNLRCPFCHNALLVTGLTDTDPMDETEILRFLKSRTGLLDGVCITGGEPLLSEEIFPFMEQVKKMGFFLKLDTNGCFPKRLETVLQRHLVDYVAMDLKNSPEKYPETVGVPGFDITPIQESIRILMESDIDYEFRTTVVSEYHTPQDIVSCAKWIQGAGRYFLQGFIDSGNLIGENLREVPKSTMEAMAEAAKKFVPETQIRGV